MEPEGLKIRLRSFAVRIMNMVDVMPKTLSSRTIANQIVWSGTSPFANYRATCRAKSQKDFYNKLKIVVEELDETHGWLELIEMKEIFPSERLQDILTECEELTRIIQASINTSYKNHQIPPSYNQ